MAEKSEYILEPLRESAEVTFYRGSERGNQMPILAAVAAEQPSPQCLRRLEHEYSLAPELDAAWAAQPLALTRYQGREALILKDPGGEILDRIVEQSGGQPFDLTRFLSIAIGLSAALGQAHRQGLIHKDVKPANAFINDAGHAWLTAGDGGWHARLRCGARRHRTQASRRGVTPGAGRSRAHQPGDHHGRVNGIHGS